MRLPAKRVRDRTGPLRAWVRYQMSRSVTTCGDPGIVDDGSSAAASATKRHHRPLRRARGIGEIGTKREFHETGRSVDHLDACYLAYRHVESRDLGQKLGQLVEVDVWLVGVAVALRDSREGGETKAP